VITHHARSWTPDTGFGDGITRMRRLLPGPTESLDEHGLLDAYAYPNDAVWVRANMVITVDGAAYGPDGRTGSISSAEDRTLFHILRGMTDVVLVGAGTIRKERYGPALAKPEFAAWRKEHGQAPAPVIAVVSRSLDLDIGSRLFTESFKRPVILTVRDTPLTRRRAFEEVADVVTAGESFVDLSTAVRILAARGYRRMLCEGGPTVLRNLIEQDSLDELCVTVSPKIFGGNVHRIVAGPPVDPPLDLRLEGLIEADGTIFARYLLSRPASTTGVTA
jgi:riboflavin biosynthesis pyrimidine reductase